MRRLFLILSLLLPVTVLGKQRFIGAIQTRREYPFL